MLGGGGGGGIERGERENDRESTVEEILLPSAFNHQDILTTVSLHCVGMCA